MEHRREIERLGQQCEELARETDRMQSRSGIRHRIAPIGLPECLIRCPDFLDRLGFLIQFLILDAPIFNIFFSIQALFSLKVRQVPSDNFLSSHRRPRVQPNDVGRSFHNSPEGTPKIFSV